MDSKIDSFYPCNLSWIKVIGHSVENGRSKSPTAYVHFQSFGPSTFSNWVCLVEPLGTVHFSTKRSAFCQLIFCLLPYKQGDTMILIKQILNWIFRKMHQHAHRGPLYIRKIKIIPLQALQWVIMAKNVKNFHFWVNF